MGLIIRPIKIAEDDLEQVSQLLMRNGLNAEKYATTIAAWKYQYLENPKMKYWVSIMVDDEVKCIYGHIGLIPLPLIQNSNLFLAGAISNGAIDYSVRNKLLPHNKKKSFPIVPLIDECCNNAFADHVELIFAFSSIHPSIWKSLNFNTLHIEVDESWYLKFGVAYKLLNSRLRIAIKNKWLSYMIIPYAFLRALSMNFFKRIELTNTTNVLKKENIEVIHFSYFDISFDPLFIEFSCEHPNVIMYQRSTLSLNWRYLKTECIKYKFIRQGKLIGYCVLREDNLSNLDIYQIEDFMILSMYLNTVPQILNHLLKSEKVSFNMKHYLSCDYSIMLLKAFKKYGYSIELNPFLKIFGKSKKRMHSPIYYKTNNNILDCQTLISLDTQKNWLIEPLFFTPLYQK